ncbi:MAG: hypothetical protein H6652_07825 [Ardenticatenaceae bacterium]|nr:hypothetical protein [Ardenticatenaceae bacterium]
MNNTAVSTPVVLQNSNCTTPRIGWFLMGGNPFSRFANNGSGVFVLDQAIQMCKLAVLLW